MKIQTRKKMAVLFLAGILAVAVTGCAGQGYAGGNAVSAGFADRETADETERLLPGRLLVDYGRIFLCYNRTANAYRIPEDEAGKMYQRLMDSKIFEEEGICLTDIAFNDYDKNGERDMLVCLSKEAKNSDGYQKDGCLYLFMNQEEPYYIHDDFRNDSQSDIFHDFGLDIDNDGDREIVFSIRAAEGDGAGDCRSFVLKYSGGQIERMELPNDLLGGGSNCGLQLEVTMDEEKGEYHIYCPYMDETVVLKAEEKSDFVSARRNEGYYDLSTALHKDGILLAGSEYIYADSSPDSLGSAVFIFDWDESGAASVKDWYVEDENGMHLPPFQVMEPLFDETGKSEEVRAYEEFLMGERKAYVDDMVYWDIYRYTVYVDEEIAVTNAGFDMQKLVNEIAREMGGSIVYTGDIEYALIDCGGDGKKQLAFHAGQSLRERYDVSVYNLVFDYKDGRVMLVYASDSVGRRYREVYPNGYVHGEGSGGAYSAAVCEGIIGADGVYRECFYLEGELGQGFYEMISVHEFLGSSHSQSFYPAATFYKYTIDDKTIYSYEIWEDEATPEEKQLVLEYIRENEEYLGVEFLTDGGTEKFVEAKRKSLGITEEMVEDRFNEDGSSKNRILWQDGLHF